MIAERNTDTSITTNIQGEKIAMELDAEATPFLITTLTKMYTNPTLACIREYSCNARDAQIEAGFPGPIEITLPSPLAPFFKVRDYGTGLNADGLRNVYSKYGRSTKRETNEQTGMFGIGSKSALAYTQQFTLVSVKDGVKTIATVSMEEEGIPVMTAQDPIPTDEANGTEVIIPAARYNSFETEARKFFSFWDEGTVLVNGEQPARIEGLPLNDALMVIPGYQSYVVMGQVPYPVKFDHGLNSNHSVVARVPIGTAPIAPPREGFQDVASTRTMLSNIAAQVKVAINGAVQREVDAQPDRLSAVRSMIRWRNVARGVATERFTYKGELVPTRISAPNDAKLTVVESYSHRMSSSDEVPSLGIQYTTEAIWFHGYDRAKWSATMRRKLNQWTNRHAPESPVAAARRYVFCADKPDGEWFDPARVFDWAATVAAEKLPRKEVARSGRIPGSYDMYVNGQYHNGREANDIDQSYPVFWTDHRSTGLVSLLTEFHPKHTVVLLQSNRVDKFKRSFPNAPLLSDELESQYKAWDAKLTDDDRKAIAYQETYEITSTLSRLDPERIDDPALVAAIKLVNKDLLKKREQRRMFKSIVPLVQLRAQNPLKSYPLFDASYIRAHADHIYLYLNAAYAANTTQED